MSNIFKTDAYKRFMSDRKYVIADTDLNCIIESEKAPVIGLMQNSNVTGTGAGFWFGMIMLQSNASGIVCVESQVVSLRYDPFVCGTMHMGGYGSRDFSLQVSDPELANSLMDFVVKATKHRIRKGLIETTHIKSSEKGGVYTPNLHKLLADAVVRNGGELGPEHTFYNPNSGNWLLNQQLNIANVKR